jgi:membrane protease YdiL (CAAX protease family)
MSTGPERALNRALVIGTLVEVLSVARLLRGDSVLEVQPFSDDRALQSKSYRRLLLFFVSMLGSSRALTYYYEREKSIWAMCLFVHVAECGYFFSEAASSDGLEPKAKILLSVIPGIPLLLLATGPK